VNKDEYNIWHSGIRCTLYVRRAHFGLCP